MPEFDLLLDADDTPLFADSDPLTFTIPDNGVPRVFHAVDRPQLPDDRFVNLQSQPRTYMIETMAANVVDDERSPLRELLQRMLDDDPPLDINKMLEVEKWLNEQREKARKRMAQQKLRRPTGGQSPSLPSSSIGQAT